MKYHRRTFAAIAVVTLVVISGCMGVSSGNTTDTPDSGGEEVITASQGDTPDSGDTPDGESTETMESETSQTPGGNNTSLSSLLSAHQDALGEAGSFHGWQTVTVVKNGCKNVGNANSTVSYNLAANRGVEVVHESSTQEEQITTKRYTAKGTTHVTGSYLEEVLTASEPYDAMNPVQKGRYLNLGHSWDAKEAFSLRLGDHNVTVQESGSTTHDEASVTEYVITGVDSERIRTIEGSMLVNENDVIVQAEWAATIRTRNTMYTFTVTQEISNVGSKTVERPDWVPSS